MSNTTNLSLNLPEDGSNAGTWGIPLNSNFTTLDGRFGGQDGHDHSGQAGEGPKLSHANLLGIGINSHEAIDAHLACLDLHQDIQIGVVGDTEGTNILNVSELRFANSTVESPSTGVVVVTPAGGGGGTPLEQTAPVTHYDAFSAPVGTTLDKQNYLVFAGGASNPVYASSADGGAVATVDMGALKTGFCTNLLDGFHPHSIVQRVGVVVAEHQPTTPLNTDNWELQLHLLASDRRGFSSPSAHVRAGVTLRLRVQDGVGSAPILNLDIQVRPINGSPVTYTTPFPAPSGFDGGSVWNGLPYQYINGHHEFSLSIPPNRPENFYLNYYYSSGLIFRHEFVSGDPIHTAVMGLVDDLKLADSSGAGTHLSPDFGRVGWSMSYDFDTTSTGTFRSNIKAVMASSMGEQPVSRVVGLPEDVETSTQVCGGTGPATGTIVGGDFDPDADGQDYGNWTVLSTFPAANGQGADPKTDGGFVIEDPNAPGTTRRIYCENPEPGPGSTVCVRANASNTAMTVLGLDLPPADFADIEFLVGTGTGTTVDWFNGGGTGVDPQFDLGEGAVLPNQFLLLNTDTAPPTDDFGNQNFPTMYRLRLTGGGRLPDGVNVSVRVTSKYNPSYTATIVDAFRTCNGNIVGSVVRETWRFDEPTATWLKFDAGVGICEGEYFLFMLEGRNLPLGPSFHTGARKFAAETSGAPKFFSPAFGIGDTGGKIAVRSGSSGNELVETLDSHFVAGTFPRWGTSTPPGVVASEGDFAFLAPDPRLAGALPATPGPTNGNGWVLRGEGDTIRDTGVFVIGKVDGNAWSSIQNNPANYLSSIRMELVDPSGTSNHEIFPRSAVKPRPPVIDTDSGTIDDPNRTAGGTPTISFEVDYPDDDFTVYFDGGGWEGANVNVGLKEGDAGVTVTPVGGFDQRERWTIDTSAVTGLTLDSAAGVSIIVYGKNEEAAALPSGAANGLSNNLGYGVTGETPNSTPVINFQGPPTLYEDGHSGNPLYANVNIWIEDDTLEANPTVQVLDASDDSVETDVAFRGIFLEQAPQPGNIPVGFTSYIFETAIVNFSPFTGADALPAEVKLRITNPEGGFADTPAIPVDQMPIPAITRISLDETTDVTEMAAAGASQLTQLELFVEVQDPFRVAAALQTTFELLFGDTDGDAIQTPTLVNDYLDNVTDLGGGLFRYKLTVENLAGLGAGDTLNVRLTSRSIPVVIAETPQEFISDSATITFTSSINVDFDNTTLGNPLVGRYFALTLNGDFRAEDYSTDVTNIQYQLYDSATSGSSLVSSDAISVHTFTPTQIVLYGRIKDNLDLGADGELPFWIQLDLPNDLVSERISANGARVIAPPVPVINTCEFPNGLTAGATGIGVNIIGDNLPHSGGSGMQAPGFFAPPVQFGYTLRPDSAYDDSIDGNGAGTVQLSSDENVFINGVDLSTGIPTGTQLSVEINYGGGYVIDIPLPDGVVISGTGTGGTGVSNLTTDGDGESGGDTGQFRSSGSETTFTITGSGLGSANVATDDGSSPVQLVVEGFSNEAGGDLPESPAGAGLHPDVTDRAFTDVTIVSQSDTQIVARATLSNIFVDTKLRVRLSRPATHPDGAGYWTDEEIDLITPANVTHPGLTLDGPRTTDLAPNSIPSLGSTRRDFSAALQAALGPNSDGSAFSVTLRLTQALTQAPVVVAVPDPTYGATLHSITVTPTASPFEWQISGRVPTTSQVNGYPASTWRAAFPVSVGLTLRNGIPIASAVLGSPLTLTPGTGGATPIPGGGGGNLPAVP